MPNICARILFLTVALLCFVSNAHSKKIGGIVYAKDEFGNSKLLLGVNVQLLSAKDSTVLSSTVTKEPPQTMNLLQRNSFTLEVGSDTCYLLRFSFAGYQTIVQRVRTVFDKNQNFIRLPSIFMEPETHVLSEIVVKATKIKMVMRGDTIVYNADAFNVAEGSMLDALIRQLPGCRLKNGVITINGEPVSSLLVDGRNFFNGDARVALEHLPAYTVDKVKVYKLAGEESRLMEEDMGDKSLVVDVNLKKKYKVGDMAEVDGGAGTHDRYGVKVSDMLFSKKMDFTVEGIVSNAGDFARITEDIVVPGSQNGRKTDISATVRGSAKGKNFDDSFVTITGVGHIDSNTETRTSNQEFLTGGDLFNVSRSATRGHGWGINSKNSFSKKFANHILKLNCDILTDDSRDQGVSRSAQLDADPYDFTTALDSIFAAHPLQRWVNATLNRVDGESLSKDKNQSYTVRLGDRWAFGKKNGKYSNNINLNANLTYRHKTSHSFNISNVDYPATGDANDDRYTYYDSPSHGYIYSLELDFGQRLSRKAACLNKTFLYVEFDLSQSYNSDENGIYRLDHLADFIGQNNVIGMLPSSRDDLISVLDAANSNGSGKWDRNSSAALNLNYQHGDGRATPKLSIDAQVPLRLQYEKLSYFQQDKYSKKRTTFFFEPNVTLGYEASDSTGTRSTSLGYKTTQGIPSLATLLDVRRDDNPLHIRQGNPSLKKTRSHDLSLSYRTFSYGRGNQSWNFGLGCTLIQDAIGTLVDYNRSTGITTSRQVNVDGNWNASASAEWSRGLDSNHMWDVTASLKGTYNHSVDLNQTYSNNDMKSKVYRTDLNGMVTLAYHPHSKLSAMLIMTADNNRATGSRSDFQNVSVWTWVANLSLNADLPLGLKATTSFNDYKMTGYNDPSLNKNTLLWNAMLSKGFLKNKLTLVVSAFDILGQVDNRMATINEQGRTETWTNTLPQYVMLHMTYKFHLGMSR